MKIGEWGKKVSVAVGVFVVLTCMGCSDRTADEPQPDADLPKGLGLMQGTWESISTNESADNCGATIEGYSIRLRYQDSPDSPMERHSSMIERIDEKKQVLIINGGAGVWPYFYGTEEGEEHLEVMFFSQQHDEWRRLHMRRTGARS